jgi:Sec-independent protein secretion pathway component TatC
MKLSVIEIVIQCAMILVVTPAAAALLTPSVDAISVVLYWFSMVVVFEIGFFLVRWLVRRRTG